MAGQKGIGPYRAEWCPEQRRRAALPSSLVTATRDEGNAVDGRFSTTCKGDEG